MPVLHRFVRDFVAWPSDGTPSMTRQEFKDECDVNKIMDRYLKTGTIPQRTDMGRYGDFTAAESFHEAQNLLIKARDQFAALPSKVRERFGNDPAKFLAFVHDPKTTLEECQEIGILNDEGSKKVEERKRAKEVANAAPSVPPASAK